ncbi:MAG: polyprenyl synthetase family protein [Holophagales bacterium]|nr:polyprenyl synthetase family protein [Holophagales bacterium]
MKLAVETRVDPLAQVGGASTAIVEEEAMEERVARDRGVESAGSNQPDDASTGLGLLERLEGICAEQGLDSLASRLADMLAFSSTDLGTFERELGTLPRRPQLVGRAAGHLLDLGGKRLRPLCLSLASRLGTGFDSRVLDLAVAVELVHSATLLHDDVVDASDVRRGAPTARAVYGNAASIFAGDWLLVEALRRVRRAAVPGLLELLFDAIEEMIFAESLQLELRGRLTVDRQIYYDVVEGKTASAFRWALRAGARAGGLGTEAEEALGRYGQNLGIAFQAVDDLLDLTGDSALTGKSLFTDLREGKMTLPLILAAEHREEVRSLVRQVSDLPADRDLSDAMGREVVRHLRDTRALEQTLDIARDHSRQAIENLSGVPDGQARRALATVAEVIVDRNV